MLDAWKGCCTTGYRPRTWGMQNPDRLRVSRAADDLADLVYDFTAAFPRDERFGLTAQMRRAAVSVGSNIYEGCSRQGNRALVAFLYIAHGSAGELVFQTRLAARRSYGDPKLAKAVAAVLLRTRRMLAALIRYHERKPAAIPAAEPRSPQRGR